MKFEMEFWLLVLLILVSSWYLFSPMIFKKSGVIVISLDKNSACDDVNLGDQITQAGGSIIKTKEDFENAVKSYKKGERLTMVAGWEPAGCTLIDDGYIGVDVADVKGNALKFGLDVFGGKRVWLSISKNGTAITLPTSEISKIKTTIEERAKIGGFSYLDVELEDGKMFINALDANTVSPLIKRYLLEGRILQKIKVVDGVGQLRLGTEYFDVEIPAAEAAIENSSVKNNSANSTSGDLNETNLTINSTNDKNESMPKRYDYLIFGSSEYRVGESFVISGVNFKVLNITTDSITLSGLVFNNTGVSKTTFASSYIKYDSTTRSYQFFVPIKLTEYSSEAFSKITDGLTVIYTGQASILDGVLVFYLDGEEINRLSLPANIAGQNVGTLNIIGNAESAREAESKKETIEMALVDYIDYDISIEKIENYKVNGSWILYSCVIVVFVLSAILFALPAVYKISNWRGPSLWGCFLFLSIVFNIFGVAAVTQKYFNPGWVLDRISIIGVISVSLWVSSHMVVLLKKVMKRGDFKIKKYFDYFVFIISFLSLFTPFRGFGIAMCVGIILTLAILSPLYKKKFFAAVVHHIH